MHVLHVFFIYPPNQPSVNQWLESYYTSRYTAEALVSKDVQVTVLCRFWKDQTLELNGVQYIFVKDDFNHFPKKWQIPKRLFKHLSNIQVDFVWLHNLRDFWRIKKLSNIKRKVPIVVQNHAETPINKFKILQRWGLKNVKAFVFTQIDQARAWQSAKIIKPYHQVYEVIEGSSRWQRTLEFGRINRLEGAPVFIWTGNLTSNKDPITILKAFNKYLKVKPKAQLHMLYRENELLSEVKAYLNDNKDLKANVVRVFQFCTLFHPGKCV